MSNTPLLEILDELDPEREGVSVDELLDEAERKGWRRGFAEQEYEDLKRRGFVYVVDGEMTKT